MFSGLSNCLHFDCLRLKVLRSRLTAFSKGPVSNPRQSISAVAEVPHEMVAWGDACESESMESEMMEYFPFLALSPGHVQEIEERCVELVVFLNDDLRPTLEARSAVSLRCSLYDEDVLSTTALDSEDLMVESGSSLPPSGQEKRNFPSYKELLDVVTRAVDKLGLDWDCEPTNIQVQSKLDGRFFTSHTPSQHRRPLPFF